MSDRHAPRRLLLAIGALSGLIVAVVALGVAELVAGLHRSWRSPILDVGDRVIDNVPPAIKDLAIEWFGTQDKLALLIGIGVLLAIFAAAIGVATAVGRIRLAMVGIAAFGVIGVTLAVTRPVSGSIDDALPTLIGVTLGAAALAVADRVVLARLHHDVQVPTTGEVPAVKPAVVSALVPAVMPTEVAPDATPAMTPAVVDDVRAGVSNVELTAPSSVERRDETARPSATVSRRDVLVRGGGVLAALAVFGAGAGAVGRAIRSRFSAAESRAALALPTPSASAGAIPAGVEIGSSTGVNGIAPFFTPNDEFYRIDTALEVPQLPTDAYELRVTGMVDRPLRLSFDDLLTRDVVEHDITLTCVSNTIGGELVGNARWLGVRLDELLAEAGVQAGATQVVGRSIDGYTCGFPVEAAIDGRNALVAFGMNGEPLPLEHGFPVRLIVPGLYGYISATKWLVEIELTTFEDFEQYWVPRGYADRAPVKLMSRIDSVDGLGTLTVGPDGTAAIGGVAWAQTRGISAVEVQIDDGSWEAAELGDALNDDTWRQWAYRFTPSGTDRTRTSIRCRAIDGSGVIQTDERSEPLPDGASGQHQIVVFVE